MKSQIEKLILKGQKRLNRIYDIALPVMAIVGLSILLFALSPWFYDILPDVGVKDRNIALGLGGFFTFMVIVSWLEYKVKLKKDNDLINIIRSNPERMVWIYKEVSPVEVDEIPVVGNAKFGQFIHVLFCLDNKKKIKLWLNEKDAELLMQMAQKLFPHVIFGYNPDIDKKYKQNPLSFKK